VYQIKAVWSGSRLNPVLDKFELVPEKPPSNS